jgi:hypothetical protein
VTTRALAVVGLSTDEARRLTDEVKRDISALREKLLRLYEGHAHLALGYSSWKNYWNAEFESHWRTGYRWLDAARVDRVIGPWTNGVLPERQARELVPLLDDEAEMIEVLRELQETYGDGMTAQKIRNCVVAWQMKAKSMRTFERDEREWERGPIVGPIPRCPECGHPLPRSEWARAEGWRK